MRSRNLSRYLICETEIAKIISLSLESSYYWDRNNFVCHFFFLYLFTNFGWSEEEKSLPIYFPIVDCEWT
jgi:hypothetical protein